MINKLSSENRATIAEITMVLLPGGNGQPAASDIGFEQKPVDSVLKSRADLRNRFIAILDNYNGEPERFLHGLPDADYKLLITVLCAAYLMDKRVKNALDYSGQQALVLDRSGFGAEELVWKMMQQPKRFRIA